MRRVIGAAIAAICAAGCAQDSADRTPVELRLEEIQAWDEFGLEVAGVVAGGDEVVIWPVQGRPMVLRAADRRVLPVPEDIQVVGARREGRGWTLVAAAPLRVLEWDGEDEIIVDTIDQLPDSLQIAEAVWSEDWYLRVKDLAEESSMIVRGIAMRDPDVVLGPLPEGLHLGVRPRGGVLVGTATEPFRFWAVEENGGGFELPYRVPDFEGTTVVGLGIDPIDEGEHIQTFADLGSDRRWIVRWGEGAEPIAVRHLNAPTAVVSSDVDQRRLVFARDLGGVEIAMYGWQTNGRN